MYRETRKTLGKFPKTHVHRLRKFLLPVTYHSPPRRSVYQMSHTTNFAPNYFACTRINTVNFFDSATTTPEVPNLRALE